MPRLPLLPPNWEDDPIFDGNAIDPAYVPGVSNPDPGELTSLQAIRMLPELAIHTKVAGIEFSSTRCQVCNSSNTSTTASGSQAFSFGSLQDLNINRFMEKHFSLHGIPLLGQTQ